MPKLNKNWNNDVSSANNVQFCKSCSDIVANIFAGSTYFDTVIRERKNKNTDSWYGDSGDSGATTHSILNCYVK